MRQIIQWLKIVVEWIASYLSF